MKYFIPTTETAAQRAAVRAAIVQRLGGSFGDERSYRLQYVSGGEACDVRVGEPHPVTRDPVLLILYENDRGVYFICTRRSLASGVPILVPLAVVRSVEYFELDEPA
ncbi:MAG TPA: hypothetical protein VK939_03025 [Longimicrobiales bacterium]|nr:hypothetical protein [Longimicrobiales bacterium]